MVMKGRGKNDYVQGNLSQKANHYNQRQLLKFSIKPLSILYNPCKSTNSRNLQLTQNLLTLRLLYHWRFPLRQKCSHTDAFLHLVSYYTLIQGWLLLGKPHSYLCTLPHLPMMIIQGPQLMIQTDDSDCCFALGEENMNEMIKLQFVRVSFQFQGSNINFLVIKFIHHIYFNIYY